MLKKVFLQTQFGMTKGVSFHRDKMNGPSGVISTDIGPNHNRRYPTMADASIKLIPLGKSGKFAIVDAEDFEALQFCKWKINGKGYAQRRRTRSEERRETGSAPVTLMHRIIMKAPAGIEVDHENLNRLDNRKRNLRLATDSQNRMNVLKFKGKYSSKFKGVDWHKQSSTWRVRICVGNKSIHIGSFRNEIDAAKAYDANVKKYFGEFGKANFAC